MNIKNLIDGGIGIGGCVLAGITMENLSAWVSLFCSLAIAVTTCGIQIYRMIRDRNKDKENENEEINNKKEKE